MSLDRLEHPRAGLRAFGLFVVVAASVVMTGWLAAEAADSSGRPALPDVRTVASGQVGRTSFTSHDPLVLVMDAWEETANGTMSEQPDPPPAADPKSPKPKKNKGKYERYLDAYFFYYFYFYPYFASNPNYNTLFPYYFNFYYFS